MVVWRFDRLGRSLKHLIELMNEMERAGIEFCSLQESINTTTPGGKLVFHIFGALAEFERNLIRERTKSGLDAARRAGGRVAVRRRRQLRPRLAHRHQLGRFLSVHDVSFDGPIFGDRWHSPARLGGSDGGR